MARVRRIDIVLPQLDPLSYKLRFMTDTPDLSLYLHIPFCRHRCAYCDFNTYTSVDELKVAYSNALVREIRQVGGGRQRKATTVYLGGGTPSLMSPSLLSDILSAVRQQFDLEATAEISLEANPDTVNINFLQELRSIGINRISFGVQSADKEELALLEREHDFDTAVQAVTMSRIAGYKNVSLDLIYGLPGQGTKSWKSTLEQVLALGPEHLSLYCLTIEKGTRMHRWQQNGRIEIPDPDLAADQYELACQILAQAGYTQYELSNWSLKGRQCQHNLRYWRNETYLGFGAGAHGHASGYRYWVVKQPRVYIRRLAGELKHSYPWSEAAAGKQRLTQKQAMSDTIITQLRLIDEGLNLADFERRYGQSPQEAYPGLIERLQDWELLDVQEQRICLTERGRFLSNQVFYRFM